MIFLTKQENAFNVGETDVRYIKKSNNFEIRQINPLIDFL